MRHSVSRVRALALTVILSLAGLAAPGMLTAQDSPLIPERRAIMVSDTDLPGGDLTQIFDVTLESCVQSCLGDARCDAFTYNQNSRACFPKSGLPAPSPFLGALSARIATPGPSAEVARARAAQVGFLTANDLAAALQQARQAATLWPPVNNDDPRTAAWLAEAQGGNHDARRLIGAVVAAEDRAADWVTLARLFIKGNDRGAAASAAINGYLRADDDAVAAQALRWLADAWDEGRGQETLAVLRHAASLSRDSDILEALTRAEDRYGMRVQNHHVDADSARPRLCVSFSHALSDTVDYAPFVRMPAGDLTVEADGSQLCIVGLAHGQPAQITLREGLPAANGEALARDVGIDAMIGNRSAAVRFPGRAYVLPSTGDRGIEVVTVNATTLDLRLLQVSDRNLIASMRYDLFARPLDRWAAQWLNDQMATPIWSGQADPAGADDPVANLNREVTTRLAVPDAAGPLAPGVYVLQASLPRAGESEDDYYYDDSSDVAAQWFVVSDLGISSLLGADGLAVVVRGLSDAGPRPGLEVALVSRANAVLATALTDAEGVARFDAGITRGRDSAAPAMITVTDWQGEGADRTARDMAFLSLTEPEFDLSDRGVAGLPAPGPIDVYMATDRGVYRAGEVVNVTAMARDGAARAILDLPLTAIFTRPDGVEAARLRLTPDAAGGYVFDLPIDGAAPRGTWRLDMRAEETGPPLASARVLVEDFLPERIDFTPSLPTGLLAAGTEIEVALTARWLFGAPAGDLPVEGWMRVAPARSLPGFDNYAFGLPDAPPPQMDSFAEGRTGEDGSFSAPLTLPPGDTARQITVSMQVSEGAGRPVERSETRTIMPDGPVVGIRALFEGDTVPTDTEARFEVIAVDPGGEAVALPLRWVLTRLDTDYVWYRAGDRWNWETVTHRRRVASGDVTSAADLPATIAVTQPWGRYELMVERGDATASGQGAAAVTFWSGWAAAGAGTESPDRLSVRLDQPAYRAGDQARLTIEADQPGTAIISVLTNRVVDLRLVPLTAGTNEVSLAVTDEWGAGAYVTATALRPLQGDAATPNRAPARRLGLAYAPVAPGDRQLQAEIEVAAESRPRSTLPVTLRLDGVAPGQTAHATIAVVDQGILNLTGYASPDPSAHYFGQRRLGVGLRDLYGRLLLSTGAPDGALREGGDANTGMDMSAPPPTEVLMAWFSGPLTVGADGTVRVEVPVPDFNGEVRVMAMAWTDRAVGQAEARALIRDPVVMVVTAPRFLAPGDSAQMTLALTQAEGAGQSALSVEAPAGQLLADTTALPATVTLAEGETTRLTLPVRVPADAPLGAAVMQLAITAPDGALLTKDITIPIMDASPEVMRRTRLTLAPGASLSLDGVAEDGLRTISRRTLTAGPFASLDVAGVLGTLTRYPYGCTEQLASVAMPLIYMPDLSAQVSPGLLDRPGSGDATEGVGYAITRILARQDASGSFGLWSAEYTGDLWLDAYVTDFLSRARAHGYVVPDTAWRAALANLGNRVSYATNPASADTWENAALAYAALVLARERAASVGDLRYYADTAADRFDTALSAAQLGAALAAYGDNERARAMFDRARRIIAQNDTRDMVRFRRDYGSSMRDRAGVIALAAEAGITLPDADAQGRRLGAQIDHRLGGGWGLSTQESVWTVLAAQGLASTPPPVTLNDHPLAQAITALPAGQPNSIRNGGAAPVDVTVTAFGHAVAAEPAGGRGYTITRSYYDMDGNPLDPAHVTLGIRMAVVIEVVPHDRTTYEGGRLIVDDPLPAGFEIDNPNLISTGDVSGLAYLGDSVETDMSQFRQDRFLASLQWTSNQPFRLIYVVRAVHAGQFAHPPALVEDMYRPEYRAWTDAGTVRID